MTTAKTDTQEKEGRQPGETWDVKAEHGVIIHMECVKKVRKTEGGGTKDVYYERPYAKTVPVVLITTPAAFTGAHERQFREIRDQDTNRLLRFRPCKAHRDAGEIWFEVGADDAEMSQAIDEAIQIFKGMGIGAKKDTRRTSYLHRREW